ncbi:MAG: DNA mismatch repair protein MutS, partial [Hyphomicrobiales bacterium]|nr:DNA mismatch repair protein MutS [Hyphomicrobiales bacterium]
RLVTPGTLTEDTLLDAGRSNYLAALARLGGADDPGAAFALAWIDISTGAFRVAETGLLRLASDIARIEPSEIILADTLYEDRDLCSRIDTGRSALTPVPRAYFDSAAAEKRLTDYFGIASLDAYGAFSRVELSAAAAALAYVERTQLGERPPLDPPRRERSGETMAIDAATRTNLELVRSLSGDRRGSLLHAVDRTVTGAGARLLVERLASPLTDPERIDVRLDAVEALIGDRPLCEDLRTALAAAPDMARALARLSLNRGGPRDLGAIRDGIEAACAIAERLAAGRTVLPAELDDAKAALAAQPQDLFAHLSNALADELPVARRDGGFVASGYDTGLDEARSLRDESRRVIAGLQADYAADTGVKALKIRHNNVLGYFVEVSSNHAERFLSAPLNGRFIHRQTTANAVRFTTTELAELGSKIASAGERALAIEAGIFDALQAEVLDHAEAIKAGARALAGLDVAAGFATLADERGYCRPRIDRSTAFAVAGGRHPVVEQVLAANAGDPFVANDCDLGPGEDETVGRIWLITGPNMSGKSTFLRQNALIAVLAQIGAFVPARSARIGVVDRLFSRVGASDDLARGRSTFMVEMIETAAILNQAGEHSLVILDEIGRGTATYDGLSIAWAAVEHLHEINRARALFATHYHELTALSQKLDRVHNATVKVKEWKGDVVFLHEIAPGAADRSYGIQVARLAGLPAAVIARAREVLERLEDQELNRPGDALIDDLPLFSVARSVPVEKAGKSAALMRLDTIEPDELAPRQALEALYELKAIRSDERDGD